MRKSEFIRKYLKMWWKSRKGLGATPVLPKELRDRIWSEAVVDLPGLNIIIKPRKDGRGYYACPPRAGDVFGTRDADFALNEVYKSLLKVPPESNCKFPINRLDTDVLVFPEFFKIKDIQALAEQMEESMAANVKSICKWQPLSGDDFGPPGSGPGSFDIPLDHHYDSLSLIRSRIKIFESFPTLDEIILSTKRLLTDDIPTSVDMECFYEANRFSGEVRKRRKSRRSLELEKWALEFAWESNLRASGIDVTGRSLSIVQLQWWAS
ncbi:hypothetical protein HYALB_00000715 [Hymenoscyphus albidus]|uniref:Uncharacterized protein n=1 Tax=Hymenoscyphus albidus TaxID=595503 RepID=A0A9N9Q384_9HELO|nr:hypothetical protein HYALB_00000715 [Hymenoscyphus albidus]